MLKKSLSGNYFRSLALGSLAILITGLLAGMSFSGLAAPSTAAATRTPTPTPTRAVLQILNKQLSFAAVGGGSPFGGCDTSLTADDLPAIDYSGGAMACLYGFQEGENVTVNIYAPDNQLAASIPVTFQDNAYRDTETSYTAYDLNLPQLVMTAPAGRWKVVAKGTHSSARNSFIHPGDFPDFTLSKAIEPGASWFDPRRNGVLTPGTTLLVEGANYPRNKDYAVAIYAYGDPLNLTTAQMIRTDSSGRFSAGFSITDQFKQGYYYVALIDPLDIDLTNDCCISPFDPHFYVEKPEQVCPGALPSYLQKGMNGMVNPGPPNNVREKPGLKNRLLGKLYEFETFTITAGPKCADGMVWWKVTSLESGLDGWTAEGQKGEYWISPSN